MGRIERHRRRVRNRRRQQRSVIRPGHRHVAIAADDERRRGDPAQVRTVIQVADGGTAPGISHRRGGEQRAPGRSDRRRVLLERSGREKAREDRVHDGRHAAFEHHSAARLHGGRVGHAGGRVGQNQVRQAIGRMHRQPLAHHPSQRQPAIRELSDAERIDQCQDVAAQLLDRVVPGNSRRGAVSARVEAKHPEMR